LAKIEILIRVALDIPSCFMMALLELNGNHLSSSIGVFADHSRDEKNWSKAVKLLFYLMIMDYEMFLKCQDTLSVPRNIQGQHREKEIRGGSSDRFHFIIFF
jgi:hypothetical protein